MHKINIKINKNVSMPTHNYRCAEGTLYKNFNIIKKTKVCEKNSF